LHLNVYFKVAFMKEKVAVATVQGKAYFLLVNKLREQDVPFIRLVPGESVPEKIQIVITTPKETSLLHQLNPQAHLHRGKLKFYHDLQTVFPVRLL
jgi:hypothetical protein